MATASADAIGRLAARVVRLPRCADASFVSFEGIRARRASRQAAAPQSHVWLRSAGIESGAHWTRYGLGSRRPHKVQDQPAVGSHGTNQSDYASRRPGAAKKTELLHRSLLAAWLASSRALQAARINCGTLERRLLVASRYPKFQCGGLDRRRLVFDRYHHL